MLGEACKALLRYFSHGHDLTTIVMGAPATCNEHRYFRGIQSSHRAIAPQAADSLISSSASDHWVYVVCIQCECAAPTHKQRPQARRRTLWLLTSAPNFYTCPNSGYPCPRHPDWRNLRRSSSSCSGVALLVALQRTCIVAGGKQNVLLPSVRCHCSIYTAWELSKRFQLCWSTFGKLPWRVATFCKLL